MKAWVVRFVSLYVFTIVVLFAIGLLLPGVGVGFAAFWGALVLTAGTIWLKPLITRLFRGIAAGSESRRSKLGEKLVQGALVFVVELILWIVVVLFSGVNVRGFFWGWVLPPIALLVAYAIYDVLDDRIEARASALYDKAIGNRAAGTASSPTSAPPAARPDPYDGLTEEQRRMLDDLGKS